MSGPILVTGPDRSGTTLLYTLLASHPNVMMVRRTNLWRWFYNRFGPLSDEANLDRCLDTLMKYKRLDVLEPDRDAIRAEFAKGSSSYGNLFGILFRQQADRLGKDRWGDKSLHTELYADGVLGEWPDAKIVHLLRDPRDRYGSVVGRHGGSSRRHASVVARWNRSTRAGDRNRRRYPSSYLLIRYEDLVSDPVGVVQRVCDFVELEFDETMLAMQGGDERAAEGGNSSFEPIKRGEISTRSVGRYRETVKPEVARFVELASGKWMRRFGYHASRQPIGVARRIKLYLLDVPIGVSRMAAWLAIERVAELRGRSAPDERLGS